MLFITIGLIVFILFYLRLFKTETIIALTHCLITYEQENLSPNEQLLSKEENPVGKLESVIIKLGVLFVLIWPLTLLLTITLYYHPPEKWTL